MKIGSKTAVYVLFALMLAAVQFSGTNALAQSAYFSSQGCNSCHTAPVVATCNGCHGHGAHSSSAKTDINVKGVTDKASYAPGETVSVTITGGYRTGWVRAVLFNQNTVELARSTGNASGMGSSAVYPAVLTAPAPTTPGTYTWKVAWYGNQYDKTPPVNGAGWTPDPNNPEHGYEIVNISSPFTVVAAADTTAPVVGAFTLPATATSLTVPVSSLTATDNVAVTGYKITTSATAPAASAAGWTATAPASVVAAAEGSNTFFAWAKDAAGNVSAAKSDTVVITLPDTAAPVVGAFTIPTTATSLTVPVSSLTATDNVAVTGYKITTSATAPAASAAGWTAAAPASVVAAAEGSSTFYAWAKDAAGNVSAAKSATVVVTLPDTAAPVVGAFTIPTTATSLTVPVSSLTATDNVAVTGYKITTSATAPAASAAGWTAAAPASVVAAAEGSSTFYAWAKDAAGNVSAAKSATVVITLPDTAAPVVGAFTIPATATSLTVQVSSLTATDNVAVTGYKITTSATAPAASAAGWTAAAPASVVAAAEGSNTFYAWAKDAAGNVSAAKSATVVITLPDTAAPVVGTFTIPATATSLTVPVSSLTATDNVAVTGYLITASATAPAANAAGWSATAPASVVAAAEGSNTFYAWAKDAAGNVSAAKSATVVITLPDTAAPVVGTFTIPATATSLTVPVSSLTATDNVAVTGYKITASATAPAANAAGWSATAPASVVAAAEGSSTFYAWAKDAAGNVSAAKSATVVITLPDTAAPVVGAFTIPATATSLTVPVSSLTATDNLAVTGYLITTSATAPAANAAGWSATAPASVVAAAEGSSTFYAWAKDAAGNVSAAKSATVVITLPDTAAPVVGAFTIPATATSLTVPVSSLTATDNVGVTGYLITTSATAPAANAAGWSATAPASVVAAAEGSSTFYAWAKDAAGNVSAAKSATVVITLPDTAAPVVGAFTLPATATSLTVPVSSLTATDNVGVTGYLITTSATAPAANAAGWSATAPASVTAAAPGSSTFYAWAKDAAGNVSAAKSATVVITLPDTAAPVVGAFTIPATATSLTVPVSSLTATDNLAVTGYLITTSATAPAANAAGWSATAPASVVAAAEGSSTFYAWAKDAAGNVSAAKSATVVITLPDTAAPVVGAFTLPATATSLTVPVSSLTATDNVGVTGYLITTSATAPAANAAGWSATAPASVTAAAPGSSTFYAWAKDAAGNVSAAKSATVVVTLPDTAAPVVGAFTIPATATSLTVPVSALTATDNVAVTGYLITTSATAPAANAAGWSATAPASVVASAEGSSTFYAWAKDAAGNVSAAKSATVVVTLPDTAAPVVGAFTIPTTATSLTVPVSSLTATDNVAVTGYKITTSATAPAASAAGWTAAAPASVVAAAEGSSTFYAWAKDAAGNVSAAKSATVVITLPDTAAPVVGTFTIPATATSLTVPVSSLTATDNVAVTGYLITASATAPAANAAGWSATAPASVVAAAEGSNTFYAWAKDAAGNVSAAKSATVVITLPDTAAPVVGTFTIPATATSLTVPVSSLTATDNVAVTGYLITASATAPAANAAGWSATAPASVTAAAPGSSTFYAWAKDAAGNVSAAKFATVVVTLPDTAAPVVGAFTIPATATSLTVPVSSLTATDNLAVTGYLITTSATAPAASAAGWSASAPASVTAAAPGSSTFYAWAKDAAGNVSAAKSASVSITVVTTAPTLVVSTLANGSYTNNATLNVSGNASAAAGIKSVTVNGQIATIAPDGSFTTAVTLVAGANIITVVASDVSGIQKSDTRTVNYDPNAPVLTIASPIDNSTAAQSVVTISGTVNETSTVTVSLNNGSPQSASINGNSFTATNYLTPGVNTIDVNATDLAGNVSHAKRTVTYDATKLSLAVTNPSQDITTRRSSLVLVGSVTDALSDDVTITITMSGKTYRPSVKNGIFKQLLTFTSARLYAITVTAKDEAGNKASVKRNVIYRPVHSENDHDD